MLDETLKKQLLGYLKLLQEDVAFVTDFNESDASKKVASFVKEVVALSPKLSEEVGSFKRQPTFGLKQKGDKTPRIAFSGLPMGHEFASFVLALLQVSGHAPKLAAPLITAIKGIQEELHFETFVSLSCHNCPDVVQRLNIMSVLNPHIHHTMVEGGMNQKEVEEKNVLAVPTVFLNGKEWSNGRKTMEELVQLATRNAEVQKVAPETLATLFDVLIVGGGVAASSAAIYAVRKGLKVGMVMKEFGGQPLETSTIENVIGIPAIEGEKLVQNIATHLNQYPVMQMPGFAATKVEKTPEKILLTLDSGDVLKTKTLIIATGAHWKAIHVPGEEEFKAKGICYCPHCDGPLFKDKEIAVIGGGNSGVEAAIDLAGICRKVTLIEYAETLKADEVLQKKLRSLKNVVIETNTATKAITGKGKVEHITYENRTSGESTTLDLSGVFILIGLQPNTTWLKETLDLSPLGEVVTDVKGATSLPGVFAAGDCSTTPYKQIVVAMSSGATAALSAFDYLIRQ